MTKHQAVLCVPLIELACLQQCVMAAPHQAPDASSIFPDVSKRTGEGCIITFIAALELIFWGLFQKLLT